MTDREHEEWLADHEGMHDKSKKKLPRKKPAADAPKRALEENKEDERWYTGER